MAFDVFISYSRKDNVALQSDKRWVLKFYEALHYYLTDSLKRDSNIFYDEYEMRGNDRLTLKIETSLADTLILLPIISSNYLKSDWCRLELEHFQKLNAQNGSVKSLIFPIIKTPLLPDEKNNLPELLNDNIYGEFFNYDITGKKLQLFDPIFGASPRATFLRISDLARQIAEFINSFEAAPPSPAPPDAEKKLPIVYLAEPSPDLIEQYNEIKRDLEQRKDLNKLKFELFIPDPKKSTNPATYEDQVSKDIKNCRLVVNLIGKEPNSYPRGSTKSHLQIQTEKTAEKDGDPGFDRLVWIPRNITSEDDADYQNFIDEIRLKGVSGDGLMQDSFEKFKSRIIEILEDKKSDGDATLPPPDESWFYVLCDKSDLDSVSELENLLQTNNYPIFSSRDYLETQTEDKNIIEIHNQYLSMCSGVLIYWNKAGLPWIRKNVFDLQRSGAMRKGTPIGFQAVLIVDASNDTKKTTFRTPPPKDCYKIDYNDLSTILSQNK